MRARRWIMLGCVIATLALCACSSRERATSLMVSPTVLAESLAARDASLAQRISSSSSKLEMDARGGATSPSWGANDTRKASGMSLGARLPTRAGGTFAIGLASRHETGTGSEVRGDYVLQMNHARVTDVPLTMDHGRAVYEGIARDVDLVFATSEDRVEWFYTLKSAQAQAEFAVEVDLPIGLPSARREKSGALAFVDARGHARLRMPPPFAIDARGTKRGATLTWTGAEVRIHLDTEGLTYPVLLDPAVEHSDWEKVGSETPSARFEGSMAYDSRRAETVLFGGYGGSIVNDTWEWDGTMWTLRTPSASPSVRGNPGMAYDSGRGKTVLFGGQYNGSDLADTWEWDGTNWTKRTAATSPPGRAYAMMAYDSVRGKTVLFGGVSNGGYVGDTWEWDGTTWTQRTSATSPSARYNGSMSYDSTRGKTVLFGGFGGSFLGDTWEWNGTTWTQSTPATSPAARSDANMVYDSLRAKTLLYGGESYDLFVDMWEWDGATWTQRTFTTGPVGRSDAAMAYDGARGKAVLFGGESIDSAYLSDTWEWDGTTWTLRTTGTVPVGRYGASMGYDSARGKTVLFGGYGQEGIVGDTWEWDGTTWTIRTLSSSPSARSGAEMVYDAARGRSVLFGGAGNNGIALAETWEFDGTSWLQRTPSTSPPSRTDASMAYDSGRGKTVLFGGDANSTFRGDTWEWDGTNWTQRTSSTSPSARLGAAMAYDVARATTVLFGGGINGNASADTWEWDGTTWTQRITIRSPSAQSDASMAYDSTRAKSVLFGGTLQVTWEWDGTNWASESSSTVPPERVMGTMTFDSARGRIVLFAGLDEAGLGPSLLDDTWEYHTYGDACTSPLQCDTGFCVDGVCCQEFACGTCQQCSLAGHEGTCTLVAGGAQDPDTCTAPNACSAEGLCGLAQGATCSTNAGCQTGFCADGVCCDTSCTGDCQVCAQKKGAAVDGFCAIAPVGTEPRTSTCGSYVCSGASPSCTTQCTNDKGCAAGYYCAPGGTCLAQKGQGSACNDAAGEDCLASGCNECAPVGGAASGQCVDGVCCDTPCDGSCDVCAAVGSIGTCSNAAAGSTGTPTCAPYMCTGSSAACGTTCASASDCSSGSYCDDTQHCKGTAAAGTVCTSDAACASGTCVDGVCCTTACTDQCSACNVPGFQGTCSPIAGNPRGTRASCGGTSTASADAGPNPATCKVGTCDGVNPTSCALPQSNTVCRADSCASGTQTFVATCDGQGNCGAIETKVCAPYACGTTACNTTCTTNADCATNSTCDVSHRACVTATVCSDAITEKTADGETQDCTPYICAAGACKTTCNSVADCAPGDICDATNQCVISTATVAPASDSGCGCHVGRSSDARVALLAATAFFALGRRRRRVRRTAR